VPDSVELTREFTAYASIVGHVRDMAATRLETREQQMRNDP